MQSILVVEGRTDAAFFRELFDRLYPDTLDLIYENGEGKYQTSEVIRELLNIDVLEINVSQDIDNQIPAETVRSIHQMVCTQLSAGQPPRSTIGRKLTVADRSVAIIPMGLHGG